MNEQDVRFPSGEWEGFYLYGFGAALPRHRMSTVLTFSAGSVTGSGVDDVGPFTWAGTYDTQAGRCLLEKRYPTHVVSYEGYAEANGIWGIWHIPPADRGGFHLWPRGLKSEQALEEQVELEVSAGESE